MKKIFLILVIVSFIAIASYGGNSSEEQAAGAEAFMAVGQSLDSTSIIAKSIKVGNLVNAEN